MKLFMKSSKRWQSLHRNVSIIILKIHPKLVGEHDKQFPIKYSFHYPGQSGGVKYVFDTISNLCSIIQLAFENWIYIKLSIDITILIIIMFNWASIATVTNDTIDAHCSSKMQLTQTNWIQYKFKLESKWRTPSAMRSLVTYKLLVIMMVHLMCLISSKLSIPSALNCCMKNWRNDCS